jgi:hypothetical protein
MAIRMARWLSPISTTEVACVVCIVYYYIESDEFLLATPRTVSSGWVLGMK